MSTSDSGQLRGEVAVIAGGATGIGAETAALLVSEGARVVVGDVNVDQAAHLVERLTSVGGDAIHLRTDVSSATDMAELMSTAAEHYGRLDVLLNNAAPVHLIDVDTPVDVQDVEVWDETFAVIARGTFLGCKYAIPHMLANGGGSIVNTSSIASLAGTWTGHAYGAAKASVNLLTKSVAARYGASGIRCNAIAPGLVVTAERKAPPGQPDPVADSHLAITPATRVGESSDIARAVLFLAVDDAAYINGQVLVIDGGMTSVGQWSELRADNARSDVSVSTP